MAYCEVHESYTAYRRPSNECPSCWRLYFETKDKNLVDYATSVASKNPDLNAWLRVYEDDIANASLVRTASIVSEIEEITEEEAEEIIEEIQYQRGKFV